MKTPRPQKQVKALFLSFTAASVLIAAPMIVMGCSSSNTAPFTAVVAGPTALTLTVAPASLTEVGQTATFTFTLDNATPTALEIPFTITVDTPSTTTFAPALPAAGTVTIPAGATTATFEATVATLPENDTTTTVTLTVPTTTLGGATASFTVVGPAAPPPPPPVVTVSPAVPAATSATYRILVTIDPGTVTGTVSAGGVTFSEATLQTVPGKTVYVNSTLPPLPLASFTEINFGSLTAAGVDFTTICFQVDAPPDPAIIAASGACP